MVPVIKSRYAPSNTQVIWCDISNTPDVFRTFKNGRWTPINLTEEEIENIRKAIDRIEDLEKNKIDKGSLATIDGVSIENNNNIDLSDTYASKETEERVEKLERDIQNSSNNELPFPERMGQILTAGPDLKPVWTDLFKEVVGQEELFFCNTYAYGVMWEPDSSECTRIGNMALHKILPIHNKLKGCVAKGGDIQYYLDPNDWAYKEDGTPSVLDGSDGTVRVDTGAKFYGKSFTSYLGEYYAVLISQVKYDDTWSEIPRMVIDAYYCTLDRTNPDNPVPVSVANETEAFAGGGNTGLFEEDLGKPYYGWNVNQFSYLYNTESLPMTYEVYKWIFYWLPIIEFGKFKICDDVIHELTPEGYKQGGVGFVVFPQTVYDGVYAVPAKNGSTNHIGNFTGKITDNYTNEPRYRGFEMLCGKPCIVMFGAVATSNAEGKPVFRVFTGTPSKSSLISGVPENYRDLVIPELGMSVYQNYINEFNLGTKADIFPSKVSSETVVSKAQALDPGYAPNPTFIIHEYMGTTSAFIVFSAYGNSNAQNPLGVRTFDYVEE